MMILLKRHPSVKFLNDKRIQLFYDSRQMAGKAVAISVSWSGHIAWDIYLFYPPPEMWTDVAPEPIHWMHQLTDPWATKETYRTGSNLRNELFVSMKHLVMK